jgi:NAD(P)H dehydrogenase (quinone)
VAAARAVPKSLIERGLPVRALVRALDERAEDLGRLGAKIAVGDYANYASLLVALENVESAYFCYPVGAGIAEAAGLFATAGRVQGLKRIVDLSLAATRPDSPSAQWVAEQIFEMGRLRRRASSDRRILYGKCSSDRWAGDP